MATDQILALLIQERDKLSRAIEALQGATKRRGRPPKNPAAVVATVEAGSKPSGLGRRKFTPAQRKQQAERMRQYWAAKRKAQK